MDVEDYEEKETELFDLIIKRWKSEYNETQTCKICVRNIPIVQIKKHSHYCMKAAQQLQTINVLKRMLRNNIEKIPEIKQCLTTLNKLDMYEIIQFYFSYYFLLEKI